MTGGWQSSGIQGIVWIGIVWIHSSLVSGLVKEIEQPSSSCWITFSRRCTGESNTVNSSGHLGGFWNYLSSSIYFCITFWGLDWEAFFCGGFGPILKVGSNWGGGGNLSLGLHDPTRFYCSSMLFKIYIKLLRGVIQRFGLSCHPQLYLTLVADCRKAAEISNRCLEAVLR